MGLLRLLAKQFAKRSPGSIGETAKVMALAANEVYQATSPARHDDLFRVLLRQRYALVPIVSEQQQEAILATDPGATPSMYGYMKLDLVIRGCWELEKGRPIVDASAPGTSSYQTTLLASEVIQEQLDKYLSTDVAKFLEQPASP